MNDFIYFSELLNPISPNSPSGEDLRYTAVYDQIREARREDDGLEQGEWQTNIKTSDWRQVIGLGGEALRHRSKDLQIGVWMTEALVRQHGFGGLADGLGLIKGLLGNFWDSLHPRIDDDDLDFRIGPLLFLNEKLPASVFQVPVCESGASRGYNYYHWEESRQVGYGRNLDKEQKKRRENLMGEGKICAEAFDGAVNAGSLAYYRGLSEQLERCRYALSELDAVVEDRFSPNPPGFRYLEEAVEACSLLIGRIYSEKRKSDTEPADDIEETREKNRPVAGGGIDEKAEDGGEADTFDLQGIQRRAISDVHSSEQGVWKQVSEKLSGGRLKPALDQLLSASATAPSVRERNRYLLLVAKLCLKADRVDLASPVAEELYRLIEALNLEQWEHPAWIADVVETLLQCLVARNESETERAKTLFRKLCMLNAGKAAAYRIGS